MNIHFRRAAAAMLTAAMLAGLPSASAVNAAEGSDRKIVVIGDGISSGSGLGNAADSYVSRLESYYHTSIVNLAKDDCTTGDLLLTLEDPEVQAQLAQADVILFSAGIQDIMEPFQQEIDRYLAENGLEFKGIDEMFIINRNKISLTEDELSTEANVLANKLRSNRETCQANLLSVGEKLSAYTNAEVIGLNVYNSLNKIQQYDTLSMKRKTAYNTIMNPCRSVLNNYVNDAYTKISEQYGIRVIDIFTRFDAMAYQYTGLNEMSYFPSPRGHAVIAGMVENVLGAAPGLAKGDVNGDGFVNAKDATMVLIAATHSGTGQGTGLTEEEESAADVDGNGIVNASDATAILRFAAAYANDSTVTIEQFA